MSKLTPHQQDACRELKRLLSEGRRSVSLGGLAGTGKTTVVSHMHEEMGLRVEQVAYCAFTGKAATVINSKFPQARATTIHSLIYRAAEIHCAKCPARGDQEREDGKPSPRCHALKTGCLECRVMYRMRDRLADAKQLIVVDESSMVPQELATDLEGYGKPIIWVGDHGQLPPVRGAMHLMKRPDVRLRKIHRHAKGSVILSLALAVRRGEGLPGAGYEEEKDGVSVIATRGSRFAAQNHEWLDGSLVVLVATNSLRAAINRAVRRKRGLSGEVAVGDRVVCLRNNREAGIFNGLMGVVEEVEPADWGGYALAKIALDGEDRVYEGKISLEQFGQKKTLYDIPRSEMDLWDYGYALTVHKAQGSEYPRVIVVARLGYVKDRQRWLYTAITRAKQELEIIYPD